MQCRLRMSGMTQALLTWTGGKSPFPDVHSAAVLNCSRERIPEELWAALFIAGIFCFVSWRHKTQWNAIKNPSKIIQWFEISSWDRQTVESKRCLCFPSSPLVLGCPAGTPPLPARADFLLCFSSSHLLFAPVTQITPHIRITAISISLLPVSLSNSMTLQEGVGKAALDFCRSNHKMFAKLVNVISAAPCLKKINFDVVKFHWYSQKFHEFPRQNYSPSSLQFQFIPQLLVWYSSPELFHQVAALPWEQLWCWKQADCLEKWKEIISTLLECFSSKNPKESSASSADWNSWYPRHGAQLNPQHQELPPVSSGALSFAVFSTWGCRAGIEECRGLSEKFSFIPALVILSSYRTSWLHTFIKAPWLWKQSSCYSKLFVIQHKKYAKDICVFQTTSWAINSVTQLWGVNILLFKRNVSFHPFHTNSSLGSRTALNIHCW